MADAIWASVRQDLRQSGLSVSAIDAARPVWWDDGLSGSASARAELHFALARRLGLAPRPLLQQQVEFTWTDAARFKHLGAETPAEQQAVGSFAMAVGRLLMRTVPPGRGFLGIDPLALRDSILAISRYVDLRTLIAACWGLGVPIVHLRVAALPTKTMHAMIVGEGHAGAIMLGRDASFPAPFAFTIAHAIGHFALGHVTAGQALVDVEDPSRAEERDAEELAADAFAMTLLTGVSEPELREELHAETPVQLAEKAVHVGHQRRIDPGTLALFAGRTDGDWLKVMSALRVISKDSVVLWKAINSLARAEINWTSLTDDDEHFLQALLRLEDV